MSELFSIFIGMALVNNLILVKFLGLCPFFGTTRKVSSAVGMGVVVSFLMFMASAATWLITNYILVPLNADRFSIVMYVLVVVFLVQITDVFIKKTNHALYNSLGIYLVLITTNCAVLGIILINNDEGYSFIESLVAALGAGIGFTLVLAIMSGIRERLEFSDCPATMKGLPIVFITATLLGLVFYGFTGMA